MYWGYLNIFIKSKKYQLTPSKTTGCISISLHLSAYAGYYEHVE